MRQITCVCAEGFWEISSAYAVTDGEIHDVLLFTSVELSVKHRTVCHLKLGFPLQTIWSLETKESILAATEL